MATNKPRITISLTPEAYAVIKRLARLQRVSASSIVVETVDVVLPAMERIAAVIESALAAPQEERENILRAVDRAELVLKELQDGLLNPPYANRGVRNAESKTYGALGESEK